MQKLSPCLSEFITENHVLSFINKQRIEFYQYLWFTNANQERSNNILIGEGSTWKCALFEVANLGKVMTADFLS